MTNHNITSLASRAGNTLLSAMCLWLLYSVASIMV